MASEGDVVILIPFIKKYTLDNIKYKLIILYLLNVTDIFFTLILLSTGLFIEANILMAKAVESISDSFLLKILLPAVLLFSISIRMKKASNHQLKNSNTIINIAIGFYSLINISHFLLFGLFLLTTKV